MNQKNMGLNPASTDLFTSMGVGQDLANDEERRKRLLEQRKATPSAYGDNMLGAAAMELFPGMK